MTENIGFIHGLERYRDITEQYEQEISEINNNIESVLSSEPDIDDSQYYNEAANDENGLFVLTGLTKKSI